MLALLQELTTIFDETAPTLIMGIEEPEIYQHPPQAKHLSEVLTDLSENGSQIMICTHSPLFIPGDNFEAVRIVRETDEPSRSYISQLSYKELALKLELSGEKPLREQGILAKLYPSLNPIINEMFFCNNLVLVEGIEDIAYISTHLMLTGNNAEFRRLGCHIVPAGGKSWIIKPLAMAKLLNIPVFVVFDADTDKNRPQDIQEHKRDNRMILDLLGYTNENEWPTTTIIKPDLYLWKTNLTATIDAELGSDWNDCKNASYLHYANAGGLRKNPLAIARALELAWNKGLVSDNLKKLCSDIITFCKNSKSIKIDNN